MHDEPGTVVGSAAALFCPRARGRLVLSLAAAPGVAVPLVADGGAGGRRCGGGGETRCVRSACLVSSVPRGAGGTARVPAADAEAEADGRGGGGRCGIVTVLRAAATASATARLTASWLAACCFVTSAADGSSCVSVAWARSSAGAGSGSLTAVSALVKELSSLAGCMFSCSANSCRLARSASFSRAASACRFAHELEAAVSRVKEWCAAKLWADSPESAVHSSSRPALARSSCSARFAALCLRCASAFTCSRTLLVPSVAARALLLAGGSTAGAAAAPPPAVASATMRGESRLSSNSIRSILPFSCSISSELRRRGAWGRAGAGCCSGDTGPTVAALSLASSSCAALAPPPPPPPLLSLLLSSVGCAGARRSGCVCPRAIRCSCATCSCRPFICRSRLPCFRQSSAGLPLPRGSTAPRPSRRPMFESCVEYASVCRTSSSSSSGAAAVPIDGRALFLAAKMTVRSGVFRSPQSMTLILRILI